MQFTLLALVQTARFIAGFIAMWQVVGLLPLVTWLTDPSSVTPLMAATAAVKILVLVVSGPTYFLLTKYAARLRYTQHDSEHKHAVPLGFAPASSEASDGDITSSRSAPAYQVRARPSETEIDTSDETLWAAAATEWHGPERRLGIWARLFAEAKGDENVAKANYFSQRFYELKARELRKQAEQREGEETGLREAAVEQLEREAKALGNLPHWAKGTCPNCEVLVLVSASNCQTCGASFEGESAWKPKPLPVP